MKALLFIDALKRTKSQNFSYAVNAFNVTDSDSQSPQHYKNLNGHFISTFCIEAAEVTLCQGLSIDYYSVTKGTYQRKNINAIDYVDTISFKGFDDINDMSLDLVFLDSQLEDHGIRNVDSAYQKIHLIIELMIKKASIHNDEIKAMLFKVFDNQMLSLIDVNKLITKDAKQRLIDDIKALKISAIEADLSQADYKVGRLLVEKKTEFHQYVSGEVSCRFVCQNIEIQAKFYLLRKYPVYNVKQGSCFNDIQYDPYRYLSFENKQGKLTLNLAKKEASLERLQGSSALFLKLHSLFALIKRQNELPCITDEFDQFYFNLHDFNLHETSSGVTNQ